MTKIFNFALKIKGGGREGGACEVLRPCHTPKFETCTCLIQPFCGVFKICNVTDLGRWQISY